MGALSTREPVSKQKDHRPLVNQGHRVSPALFEVLTHYHRMREDYHREEKALTLRVKAVCRRMVGGSLAEADKLYKSLCNGGGHPETEKTMPLILPYLEARAIIEKIRKYYEGLLRKEARKLPIWQAWVQGIRGIDVLSLGQVIAETGDLANYDCPAKVWKRMGLAVLDGMRQRKMSGEAGIEMGYSPRRRAIVWNVGACLIRAKSPFYYQLYLDRKEYEFGRNPEIIKGHAHNRAKRYMEKRFLKDFWLKWNQAGETIDTLEPNADVSLRSDSGHRKDVTQRALAQ